MDKAIDMATKDFLEKGIDAITYSDGKKVNIASYAEMALRTANHRAYLMGEGKKRQEMGLSLVVVSAHATACELCVPWQGLVLIDDVYSGGRLGDGPYPLLSEAMDKGLMHPNCRHNLTTYFPGITTLPNVPDPDKVLENYRAEQKQRYIERQIRRYKRLAEGSISQSDIKEYSNKVKEWQKMQRDHLEGNLQLRRDYNREQTKGVPFDYGQNFNDLIGIETQNGIKISGVSQHFKIRAVDRGVSSKNIENALINPVIIDKIKIDMDGRRSQSFTGIDSLVHINPDTGTLITSWRIKSKKKKR